MCVCVCARARTRAFPFLSFLMLIDTVIESCSVCKFVQMLEEKERSPNDLSLTDETYIISYTIGYTISYAISYTTFCARSTLPRRRVGLEQTRKVASASRIYSKLTPQKEILYLVLASIDCKPAGVTCQHESGSILSWYNVTVCPKAGCKIKIK